MAWLCRSSRERVLSDNEIPKFWTPFDDAGLIRSSILKMILLTGQRPGEVTHMRTEHIEGGGRTLPGKPVPALVWLGTKNATTHRVWLPKPAQATPLNLLAEHWPPSPHCSGPRRHKKAPDDAGAFYLIRLSRDQYLTAGPPQLKR